MEIVLLFVGLAFAGIGVLIFVSARTDAASGQRYEGIVTGYALDPGKGRRSRTYAPVVTFQHPEIGNAVFRNALASGSLPYPPGRRVPVLVRRDETLRARIDTSGMSWFGGVFFVIGVACVAGFFATFRWSAFSIFAAVAVTVSIAWRLRRFRERAPDVPAVARTFRRATTAEVFSESSFDRSALLPAEELDALLRRQPRNAMVAAALLLLLGCGGLAGSWFWMERRSAFLARAAGARGTVVDFAESRGSKTTTWAPVVEFTPARRWEPVRFRHPVSSSHPSWSRGDEVGVLYDPANPTDAMIDSGVWNRATPLLPGLAGLLLFVLGILSVRSALRHARAPSPFLTP